MNQKFKIGDWVISKYNNENQFLGIDRITYIAFAKSKNFDKVEFVFRLNKTPNWHCNIDVIKVSPYLQKALDETQKKSRGPFRKLASYYKRIKKPKSTFKQKIKTIK